MKRLMREPKHIDAILADGADRARAIAAVTMKSVKEIVGFVHP
jgi:tryptophanyl-tRNA synthetase